MRQQRRQPAFGFRHGPALALRVIGELVGLDPRDAEIMRVGMREIKSGNRGRRIDRVALGQRDAELLRIEQFEQCCFLGVVGLGRIARRRTDTAIALGENVLVRQRLVGRVGPEFAPHPAVQMLGEGFRQAIGQRLEQDR